LKKQALYLYLVGVSGKLDFQTPDYFSKVVVLIEDLKDVRFSAESSSSLNEFQKRFTIH